MSTGVGARIKQARIDSGLTQAELAAKMGKTKSLISKVENGLDNMTSDKIAEYAAALNVTPAYLMGWESLEDMNKIISRKAANIADLFAPALKQMQDSEAIKELISVLQSCNEAQIKSITKMLKAMKDDED